MFLFKGLRTVKKGDAEHNVKVLGYTNFNQEILSDILGKYSIVILSFSEYKGEIHGKPYEVGLKGNDDELIDIIFPMDNENARIKEAFEFFMDSFGIKDISYIKPYGVNLSEEKQKILLRKLFQDFNLLEDKKIDKKSTTKKNKLIDANSESKQLVSLKKDITEFIADVNEILPECKEVDPSLSFELENFINELQKYKRTTNIYKIGEIYKSALEIYDKLYNKYFDYLKKQELKQEKNKIISDLDIVREYKNYMKVQRAKSLERVDQKQFGFPWYEVIYYKIFGKFGVNLKLIFKEFIEKYKLDYFGFSDILNFFQLLFLFLIIDYSLILLYKSKIVVSSLADQLAIYYIILNFAIFGFIVTLGKIIAKKSILFSIVVMIILFILFVFIKRYFAL